MWFKLFVLFRIPISAVCLFGYGHVQSIQSPHLDPDCFVAACNTAAFVFLAVVSIKLVRRRPSALRLAGWLLALETVGALLLLVGGDYVRFGRIELGKAAGVLLGALLLWALPNAILFYKARSLFVEPAKEKPGV